MKIYRAYLLIEDMGSYKEFYRSPWFMNEELAHDFIKKSRIVPGEYDYQWEIQGKDISDMPIGVFDIEDYRVYHEFNSE